MKSKLVVLAAVFLGGCGSPQEFKVSDYEHKRTIYYFSRQGLEPPSYHGGVIGIDMPDGRRIILRDYKVVPTQEHFGKTLIVDGLK